MKKLINKLFEWWGYVPERDYNYYEKQFNLNAAINREIINCQSEYFVVNSNNRFIVLARAEKADICAYIKAFPYTDDESKDYARICAEELCDMLNEKY